MRLSSELSTLRELDLPFARDAEHAFGPTGTL